MKLIYVAGASAEIGLIVEVMRSLREAGYLITYDWTEAVSKFGGAGAELTDEQRQDFAVRDLFGVETAEILWMLAPQNHSVGAWVELGAAIALRRSRRQLNGPRVVVSGLTDSIFALLADKRFATHDEALSWLIGGMS